MILAQGFEEENTRWYYFRWFYDLGYKLIIKVCLLQIIFGIIIDAFSRIFSSIISLCTKNFIELRGQN